MGDIQRGLRIAAGAVRAWRANPLLPFVVRGLLGERHRLKMFLRIVAISAVAALSIRPVAWIGLQSYNLGRARFGQLSGACGFLALHAPGWFVGIPFRPSFLVPVVAGLMARRWFRSSAFQREIRALPGVSSAIAGGLVALVVFPTVAASVLEAAMYVAWRIAAMSPLEQLPVGIYLTASSHVRDCLFAWHHEGTPPATPLLPIIAETVVRIAGLLREASVASICLAALLLVRSLAGGIALAALLNGADAALHSLCTWVFDFQLPMQIPFSRGTWLAKSLPGLASDLLARPALALAWMLVACWAIGLLRRRLAGTVEGDGAARS